MIQKDERGEEYRLAHRWVDAWEGPPAGWQVLELREYICGCNVHRGEAKYLKDNPDMALAHKIYMLAKRELEAG